jgi:predicted amidohydrolase YtcJ
VIEPPHTVYADRGAGIRPFAGGHQPEGGGRPRIRGGLVAPGSPRRWLANGMARSRSAWRWRLEQRGGEAHRRRRGTASLAVALALWVAGPGAVSGRAAAVPPPADLVLRGGAVYTLDAARSWAEAVAVRAGSIVYVGDDAGAAGLVGPETAVVELGGAMVLPGFQDSHVHPVSGGVELGLCDLNGSADAEEVARRLRAYAAAHPERPWITGGGWDLPLYPQANPRREALDALVGDRPAYLSAADGHSAWVSSRALALAGVTAATPDPPGGRIERDPTTGEPSGTLREAAMALVARHLPPITAEERAEGLRRFRDRAHRVGITGVLEASADGETLAAYRELATAGALDLHVAAALYVDPLPPVDEEVARVAALAREDWGDGVTAGWAKLFADGVIEAGTAALLAPYVGLGGSRGELAWPEEKLRAVAVALDRAGFELHVHAIGDRAIRVTLDAVAEVRRTNGPRSRRPTLAHIQLFDPADLDRLRELGAIASFQPLWAWADPYILELTEPKLGTARSRWLYPIASVVATGAVVAAGSDWSVSSLAPLEGIEVALTRRANDAGPGPAWIPEERATLATMLAAYTIGAAYAARREAATGSIEVGKRADLVVLARNLFTLPAHEISETAVWLTYFGGREVWRHGEAPAVRLGGR